MSDLIDRASAIAALQALPAVTPPPPTEPPPINPEPPAGLTVATMDWMAPQRLILATPFAVKFTTGNADSPANNLPKFVCAEYGSAPMGREANISLNPGDFANSIGPKVNGSTTVTLPFSVGPNGTGFYPALARNTTYYVNVRNTDGSSTQTYADFLKPGSGY